MEKLNFKGFMEFVPSLSVQSPQSWNSGFTFGSKMWPNLGFLMLPPATSRLPCNGCVLFELCFIYHAHWVNNRKNLLTIAAPLWEDKFCSHCKLFSVAFLFALFRNAEDKHCRVQFGGWENGSNSSKLESVGGRIPVLPSLYPKLRLVTRALGSSRTHRAERELDQGPCAARSEHLLLHRHAGRMLIPLNSIYLGVICVWLLLAKFSQIDLYGASNYLLGSPMPKKKNLLGENVLCSGKED